MNLLRLFLLLLLITGLTSCNLFKTVSSSHESEKIKTKTDSTYSSTVTDKTKTTIIERIDTVATTKPVRIITEKPATIDSAGIVSAMLDTLMVRVKVSYNALTKAVSFDVLKRPEFVPVVLDRVTVTEMDKVTESAGKVSTDTKTKNDSGSKKKEPQTEAIVILIGAFVFVLLIIGLFLYYKTRTVGVIKAVIKSTI